MTLHEIEQTLDTLRTRHPGLDEGMLVTLLRSGGWEEKQVEEARMMFKTGSSQNASREEYVPLPPVETERVLPLPVDDKHLLLAHNDEAVVEVHKKQEESEVKPIEVAPVVPVVEPQSLVSSAPVQSTEVRDGLPHNLPLRPFETSEHIWPLSRYKDVFYGNSTEEARTETLQSEIKKVPAVEERVTYTPSTKFQPFVPTQTPTPEPSSGDEKLVIMACVMLLVILLLLGYMYSNGRL